MGRPPTNGAPSFRFHPAEVAQLETMMHKYEGHMPPRDLLVALAERFSNSPERAGKTVVQMKQIWNWFQNRRYALRAKLVKSVGKSSISLVPRDEVTPVRHVTHMHQQLAVSAGSHAVRNTSEASSMEFEAKSGRDGAWYDVVEFRSHRYLETGNPEVLVRFSGFATEEDEWVNIRKHVRQRSCPCEQSECIAVLPGDLVLCFQDVKEQALYFDAHVLDVQRMRHDMRGCRCRFLVRYDHDQSEEIVPLRKMCRRPETDSRLHQLHAMNEAASSLGITNFNSATTPTTISPSPITGVGPHVSTSDRTSTPSPIVHHLSPSPVSAPLSTPASAAHLTPSAQIYAPVTLVAQIPQNVKREKPTQIPVSELMQVKSANAAQIPDPFTDPNNIETDPPSAPEITNPAPVAVAEPIKAENDNPTPVSVPEVNKVDEDKVASTTPSSDVRADTDRLRNRRNEPET